MIYSLDLETVPNEEALASPAWQEYKDRHPDTDDHAAGLYPEFGQICCASLVKLDQDFCAVQDPLTFLAGNASEEQDLLQALAVYLPGGTQLVGHAIKKFDIPFLAKRWLWHHIRGLKLKALPLPLSVAGKKPWEIIHVDTMELLTFGGYPGVSLRTACYLLGIRDPKANCYGKDVWDMFKAGNLQEIGSYCNKDAVAAARIAELLWEANAFADPSR